MVDVSTFFVLDFDRCLGNEKLYDLLDETIATFPEINMHTLRQARAFTETEGGSFDALTWLAHHATGEEATTLTTRLIEKYVERADVNGGETYLATGAQELLRYLQGKKIPYVIMTYGGREYQTAKLRAAGLQREPRLIVASPQKSHYIHEWWNSAARHFIIPATKTIRASEVILIDDKAAAFKGLPAHVRGYLVEGEGGSRLRSQYGRVSSRITRCRDLTQVIADLRQNE